MQTKSQEELNQIATDLFHGRIFTDRHVNPSDRIDMVFMVLALLNKEQIEELKSKDIGLIYEYLDKAGPRSCNGMPMFMSFQYLSTEDTKTVLGKVRAMQEAIKAVMDKPEPPTPEVHNEPIR